MTTGPVSQALHAELLQEVRRQGIVVWLDKDASYTGFVDRLVEEHTKGAFPYPVIGFRGSFLETLLALEAYGSGYDKNSLVIHMPGFNEESIRTTPVLELYEAGTRFRRSLESLVRDAAIGRALSGEVDNFLRSKPTLEKADEWLTQNVSKRTVGIEPLLESSGTTMIIDALVSKESPLAARVTTEEEAKALRSYLHKLTGMDDEWFSFSSADPNLSPIEKVLNALSSWILCIEYVYDLQREPHLESLKRLKSLPAQLVKVSTGIVVQLRKNHADTYVELADEAEATIDSELKAMAPEDLGHIDTFREEENRVLRRAVELLKLRDWAKVIEWSKAREGDRSFWLQRDPARRRVWNLVTEAAVFGRVLTEHARPYESLHSYEDALSKYTETAALVDRAHRHFEQEWLRRLDTQMPHYGALQEVLGELRQHYRAWADGLAKDFNKLCKNEGFLPPENLQQRTLYDQVVQPMAFSGEKVAVFLLDAFRYEMATELVDDFRATGSGAVVDLKARFAELPTITSVGMNALAPVAHNGRLTVAGTLQGFRSGEYTVRTPTDRVRAMGTRTSGKPGLQLALAEVCDITPDGLKRKVKDHQIIVVCSTEIDDAGEANVGLLTFEVQLNLIKAAWHHLQSAGIKHAVFAADHGFLLQDTTTQLRTFGKKTTPKARYVLDDYERGESGIVPVAFSKLGYDDITGYVLFPEDTAVFATGAAGASFVHGGNSPQERIIPVLTVTHKAARKTQRLEFAVEAEPLQDAFGFHRIRLRLKGQMGLAFVGVRSLELDLQVPERRDIRALIKEVSGAGTQKSGRIQAPVGDDWTEVFFALEGPEDERVPIQVHHGDNIEEVVPCVLDALFAVSGVPGGKRSPTAPPPASSWADAVEDEGIRGVFIHIEKHGSITEAEIITMLGNARAARRFALNFDHYLTKLPFRVRSESNTSGKRYVREEEK